jgi:hypothetical protein
MLVSSPEQSGRPNNAFEPTPLCGDKIAPILKAPISSRAFPIY